MDSAAPSDDSRRRAAAIVVGTVWAVGVAIAIAGVCVFAGNLLVQVACVVAGMIVCGSAIVQALRRRSANEAEIESGRESLDKERRDVRRQERQIRKQLEAWTGRLEKRERKLAERLMTYHEWTEFPVADPDAAPIAEDPIALAKDRELEKLLENESRDLLEKLQVNYFAPTGVVDSQLVRQDFMRFLERVVRVYEPNAKDPLMETSVAHLCRATSRVSLHLLILLDQLPVNLKDSNLSQLYAWARRAAQAYRVYKTSEPYFPAATSAWYLARMAMGANPVSLAVWWGIGEFGKRGAVRIASQLLQQQALVWVDQSLRIIAHEAAAIYGTDFRYRDPDWLYAAELADAVSRFPESPRAIRNAFREVGVLPLRSEYDRFYLYRMIAERKSARPERYATVVPLSEADKRRMLARLEEFVHRSFDELPLSESRPWKETLEARYGMALRLRQDRSFGSLREQGDAAARYLANYLRAEKGFDRAAAAAFLAAPERASRAIVPAAFEATANAGSGPDADDARESPWEFPLLEPKGALAAAFIDDFAVAALERPYRPDDEPRVEEAAESLGVSRSKTQRRLRKLRGERLARLGEDAASLTGATDEVQRLALALIAWDERVRWIYGSVERALVVDDREETRPGWMIGTDRQWLWISNDGASLSWPYERRHQATLERERFALREDVTVEMPAIDDEGLPRTTFRVPGSRWRRAEKYFAPLIEYFVGDKSFEETLPEGDVVLDDGSED